MRATFLGLLIGIGATTLTVPSSEPRGAYGQRSGHHAKFSGAEIVAITGGVAGGQQVVLLVDPVERTLGSYQVDMETGQVVLRSVRNCRWDLQMDEFNGKDPSPEQIKALLQSR